MTSQVEVHGGLQLRRRGQQIWSGFANFLFPPRCGGCQTQGRLWCDACCAATAAIPTPLCEKCGKPYSSDRLCTNCRVQPPQIDRIRSVALFEGPLRQGIHRFKYERLAGLADPFGDLLADYWLAHDLVGDWLMPVPLHSARERDRGYNQSALLARRLSQQVGVPVIDHGLKRIRATAAQMELTAAQRKMNVAGAFDCVEPRAHGARVVVIDDVCTTGATLDACAEALWKAGAVSVMGLTLARTP